MAGGHVAVAGVAQDRAELYHNRLTVICFIYCLLISWAGGLFGLDLDKSLSLISACDTHLAPQLEVCAPICSFSLADRNSSHATDCAMPAPTPSRDYGNPGSDFAFL